MYLIAWVIQAVHKIAGLNMQLRIDSGLMASIHIIYSDWDLTLPSLYTLINKVSPDLPIAAGCRQVLLVVKEGIVR